MTSIIEDLELPRLLPLEYLTVSLPEDLSNLDTFDEYKTVLTQSVTLLSLIPYEDLEDATYDDYEGWLITTSNPEAIRYAILNDYVSLPHSLIDGIINNYANEVCESCIDDLINSNLNRDFEVRVLDGKAYVYFTEAE